MMEGVGWVVDCVLPFALWSTITVFGVLWYYIFCLYLCFGIFFFCSCNITCSMTAVDVIRGGDALDIVKWVVFGLFCLLFFFLEMALEVLLLSSSSQ